MAKAQGAPQADILGLLTGARNTDWVTALGLDDETAPLARQMPKSFRRLLQRNPSKVPGMLDPHKRLAVQKALRAIELALKPYHLWLGMTPAQVDAYIYNIKVARTANQAAAQ